MKIVISDACKGIAPDRLPLPEAFTGPRNAVEERVCVLVLEAKASGPDIPLDEAFYAEIDAIIENPS